MKVYTYSNARQRLAELLDLARSEDVMIERRGGERIVLRYAIPASSPLDVPGMRTKATTADILTAVRDSRRPYAKTR